MRRLGLVIFLVCLMTASVSATNTWNPATGFWNVGANWSRGAEPNDTEEVKINKSSTTCTLNTTTITFAANKVTMAGGSGVEGTLYVTSGGKITMSGTELNIGSSAAGGGGPCGKLTQDGGDVVALIRQSDQKAGKIEVGYKAGGTGTYTMTGGTISGDGSMYIGGAGEAGAVGTFIIEGTAPSISIGKFYVGVQASSGTYPGTGNVEFKLGSGVSPIVVTGDTVAIDPIGTAVANLVVSLTDADVPPPVIVLIKNSGTSAVSGKFDSVNGGGAGSGDEGASVVLSYGGNNYNYTLTYQYNADGTANDVALIPEPATIALFGLGLLALVRRPRRK